MRAGVETLTVMTSDLAEQCLLANAAKGRCERRWKLARAGVAGVVEIRSQGLMLGISWRPGRAARPRRRRRAAAQRHRRQRGAPAAAADHQAEEIGADRALVPLIKGVPRGTAGMKARDEPDAPLPPVQGPARRGVRLPVRPRASIKRRFKNYERYQPLQDRTLAMIFEPGQHRTRVSFEAACTRWAARSCTSPPATATGPCRTGGSIGACHQSHGRPGDDPHLRAKQDRALAAHSRVPVINGLTNEYHPCQILADLFTFEARAWTGVARLTWTPSRGRVAWVGDGNNMANTWLQAAGDPRLHVHASTPSGYEIDPGSPGVRTPACLKTFWDPDGGLRRRQTSLRLTSGPAWATRPRTKPAGGVRQLVCR